jgi:hypothetical protein
MVAVVTIAGATGTGWLAGMPAREAPPHQPTRPAPVSSEQDVDVWSRFEDGWVEA